MIDTNRYAIASTDVARDTPTRLERIASLAFVVALIAHAVTVIATVIRYDGYEIAKSFFADDAFYYLEIANRIAAGEGSTFDGTSATNGYHPLWMVCCIVIAFFTPRPLQVEGLYVVQGLLVLGAAYFLKEGLRRFHHVAACLAAGLFVSSGAVRYILMNGMESALGFSLLALLAAVTWSRSDLDLESPRRRFVIFVLLLGISLARLEMGLLAASFVAAALFSTRSGASTRRGALWILVGLSLAGISYIGLNLWIADWPVPISGSVKWGQPELPEVQARTWQFHLLAFISPLNPFPPGMRRLDVSLFLGAVLLGSSILVLIRSRELRRAFLVFVVPCVAFVIVVVHRSGGFTWYGWPALFLGVLATFAFFVSIVGTLPPIRSARKVLGLACAIVIGGYAVSAASVRTMRTRTTFLYDWSTPEVLLDEAIAFVRGLPPGERVAGSAVGLLAFMSERSIVQTEGLVNDREYMEALRGGRAAEVLRARGVRWFIAPVHDRERTFPELFAPGDLESTAYLVDLRRLPPTGTLDDVMVARLRMTTSGTHPPEGPRDPHSALP